MSTLFAQIVREHAERGGASHRPSATFRAVLAQLGRADGWTAAISRDTGHSELVVSRVLTRMCHYGLATAHTEVGDAATLGRGLRRYHTLTPLGRRLHEEIGA